MKKLEFTTGKGRFVVVEWNGIDSVDEDMSSFELISHIEDITEQQASEIVDKSWDSGIKTTTRYPNYETNNWSYYGSFGNAIKSLNSLIKSKGWYLYKNPIPPYAPNDVDFHESAKKWFEAESRTLHNPVIFKIASDKV